jgi:S-adenosylmethionine:tRNA ribosyltransferase-isomerase
MKLSHFQFDLPKNCWQNFRLNTEMKRLMVIDRKKQTIEHKTFKDVIDYFDDGDVLILNNTKVFRLYGNKEKQEQESKFFY